MQTYGDVIANANKTDVSNYLKYKKYNWMNQKHLS
jgi:hypothetical protein